MFCNWLFWGHVFLQFPNPSALAPKPARIVSCQDLFFPCMIPRWLPTHLNMPSVLNGATAAKEPETCGGGKERWPWRLSADTFWSSYTHSSFLVKWITLYKMKIHKTGLICTQCSQLSAYIYSKSQSVKLKTEMAHLFIILPTLELHDCVLIWRRLLHFNSLSNWAWK